PRFEGPSPPGDEAYAETLATQLDHGWAPLHAPGAPPPHYARAPRPELYDVAGDPREERNLLVGAATPEAREMDQHIAALLADELPLRTAPVAERTKQHLHTLGYAVTDQPVAQTGLDPKDGLPLVVLYVEAKSAFGAGDLARAESRARELLAASPRSGQAPLLLSSRARARGDLRTALAEAERAALLVPQAAAYQTEVGDLRLELGDS